MSENKENDKANLLLDDIDYEYEKKIYDQQKQQQAELDEKRRAAAEARKKREREAQKERDRQFAKERLELMKLKSGAAQDTDDSDDKSEITEHSDEDADNTEKIAVKVPFKKKAENFFYHNKWWIGIACVVLFISGFLLINFLTTKTADLRVIVIANSGLEYKQERLEELFEEYVDDIDGNGYVHVSMVMMPLTTKDDYSEEQQEYRSKFLSMLHSTDEMLIITDSKTDPYYLEILDHDLKSKFPGNKYIDENGFSLNMKLVADRLEYADMPNDIHVSIRQPVATVDDSEETALKNYEKNFAYLKKMVEDLTEKAEKSKDPGLKAPSDSSSSSSET